MAKIKTLYRAGIKKKLFVTKGCMYMHVYHKNTIASIVLNLQKRFQ